MTATGSYIPGMDVFVTRDFRPHDPINREEKLSSFAWRAWEAVTLAWQSTLGACYQNACCLFA